MDFLNNYCSHFGLYADVPRFKASTQRKLDTITQIWDWFLHYHLPNFQGTPGVQEIVAYMFYRVVTPIEGDRFAGTVSLKTFRGTEFGCLFHALRAKYGSVFTLEKKDVQETILYQNGVREIVERYGEGTKSVHARPMWFQDERRLINCTSVCTAGIRDRAVLRVMLRTGGRLSDLAELDKTLHVEETSDHRGDPAILVLLPNVKNQREDTCETWITGEAYLDVKAWIERRKVIFRDSVHFFVTNTGKKLSAEAFSMVLDTLCRYAGYGPKFFSAHSGRMGFASRAAAEIFANGGTVTDVYATMGASGLWAPGSHSIARYCDTRTRRFFQDGEPLTFEQFKQLSPEKMHGLEQMEQPRRRAAAWFHQDDRKLRRIARSLGKEFPIGTSQYVMRLFIGKCIFSRDPAFRRWLKEYYVTESVNSSLAVKPVTRLLERDLISESDEFCFDNLSDEQIMRLEDDMFEEPPSGDEFGYCLRQRARQIRTVRIQDENHFFEAQRLFKNRYADRQVTIALFPNDRRAVLNARNLDTNCTEVSLLEGQFSVSNDEDVELDGGAEDSPELAGNHVESPLTASQFSQLLVQNPLQSFSEIWRERRAGITSVITPQETTGENSDSAYHYPQITVERLAQIWRTRKFQNESSTSNPEVTEISSDDDSTDFESYIRGIRIAIPDDSLLPSYADTPPVPYCEVSSSSNQDFIEYTQEIVTPARKKRNIQSTPSTAPFTDR